MAQHFAKDPDFERRHPGRCATIEVVALVPYSWFEAWQETSWRRRGPDYDAFKQGLSIRLQNELEQRVPAISGKIDYAESSTPLSTRHFMNYERGESYKPVPNRTALKRVSRPAPEKQPTLA